VQIPVTDPPLAPNQLRWMERGLYAFAATALTEQQNDGDFAEEEFQFDLRTVLDGIEARITRLTSATRRQ
jgi:hypothetical protein